MKTRQITDHIKSYKDACAELGETPLDESALLDAGLTPAEIARRKVEIITRALNEGWRPDWKNNKERKYWSWFDLSTSSGFAFRDTIYHFSTALAGDSSRLCFKSDELARYAGQQFIDLYKTFML